VEAIDEAVILVGPSFGGSVLLRYLAEGCTESLSGVCFLSRSLTEGRTAGPTTNTPCRRTLTRGCSHRGSSCLYHHSRDEPVVPFTHLSYYWEHLPMATARPIDGLEHSFVDGLPTLVDDIKSLTC
jgi:predicted alpha/beta hydrolase family esterase